MKLIFFSSCLETVAICQHGPIPIRHEIACKGVPHVVTLWLYRAGGTGRTSGMARNLRLQYPGAIYHLTSRGGHRGIQEIFNAFLCCSPTNTW
jgi:hypothetical protein